MKMKLVLLFALVSLVALGQSSAPSADDRSKARATLLAQTESSERALIINRQLGVIRHEEARLSRMPGVHVKTPEDKLVRELAEEILYLREQVQTLQKQLADLSAKKG